MTWESTALGAQSMAQDALDELGVGQPGLQRGQREILVGGEDGIRIGLDEVQF